MLQSLNTAQSGLKVSQTQVEGVMNNLANENTVGYKSRTVNTVELDQNDMREIGRGAAVQDVTRSTNVYMYQNLIEEESKNNSLDELNIMLEDIESIFFETDEAGLSADLNRYFESIENLRTSPYYEIYRNDVKNNANILVNSLQTLYSDVETREATTIGTAKEYVAEINNILTKIGEVSFEIENSVVTPHDLYDRRDALEKELSQYIDVEISREDNYTLSIGGHIAVRHSTNVRDLELAEEYQAQKDVYTLEDTPGYVSSLIDKTTWNEGVGTGVSETQNIVISGTATAQVSFLGTHVDLADGSAGHQTPTEIATDIDNDKINIINNWNTANFPDKQIKTDGTGIVVVGETITITYEDFAGDVEPIAGNSNNGISFSKSYETQKGDADSVTYRLNSDISVKVTYGEVIINAIDTDNDGVGDTDLTVDENNLIQALVHKINDPNNGMDKLVTAYNGNYHYDNDGNMVLKEAYPTSGTAIDHYLVIESTVDGEVGSFNGEIIVADADAGYTYDDDNNFSTIEIDTVRTFVDSNSMISKDAVDNIYVKIYEEELDIQSGRLKSLLDNVDTESGNNKFSSYKEQLDQFAKALSDLSSTYIENDDESYVYGTDAMVNDANYDKRTELNLFDGSDVKSLSFNDSSINSLRQQDLDYLATIQWKDDIDFDGTGEHNTSFYTFYQELRFNIADDREGVRFRLESQEAVTESLQKNYDKITKVDKDEEMIELIKFQAAYEANAKMVTVVDEMLQTILGMKR